MSVVTSPGSKRSGLKYSEHWFQSCLWRHQYHRERTSFPMASRKPTIWSS